MNYKVTQHHHSVIEVRAKYKKGFEQWFLLSSDHHWDNPKCDLQLLEKHHKEAKERNAGIFCFGDKFCLMQGKYDKRSSKSDLRDEHKSGSYLDKVIETAVDWYAPYANNYILCSDGNHETAIKKRHETDILQRYVDLQNAINGSSMLHGKYSGWIVFKFEHIGGGGIRTFKLFYHHGSGGGGPVTKGVIQTNRRAVYVADADLVVTGHVHERWQLELVKERLNKNLEPVLHTQTHICTATYKEEYLGHEGWHIERGAAPKPLGGIWLRFQYKNNAIKHDLIFAD